MDCQIILLGTVGLYHSFLQILVRNKNYDTLSQVVSPTELCNYSENENKRSDKLVWLNTFSFVKFHTSNTNYCKIYIP